MPSRLQFLASSFRIVALSAASILGAFHSAPAWAVPPRPESTPSRLVQDALAREAQGVDSGREALLQAALHQSPGYAPARWHSGYVKFGKRWAKFDEVAEQAAARRALAVYRLNRNRYPQTVAGQLNLAKWCSQRKLREEARAHYTKVLELDPNHAEARARLGFRRVEGVWLSAQEVRASRERAKEAVTAMRKWRPRLEKLRKQLQSSNPKVRAVALEKIKKIDDPAAIPAMELVLSTAGEKTAKLVIETLASMTAFEASIALSRHAVFAPFVYAIREHAKFWDSKANGGYDYAQFFLPDELPSASLVLYSTSLLFASIAALAGCACFLLVRWTTPESDPQRPRREAGGVRRQAILLAVLCAIVIGVPWQVKALPEIRAENGWIFPAVLLMFTIVGLAPLLLVSGLALRRDFRDACTSIRYVGYAREMKFAATRYPRASEFALWTLFLFPVYPFWHFLRWRCRFFRWQSVAVNYICLMSLVAAGIVVSLWIVNTVDEWFDFEDWRGMLRAGELPFLRVFFSLLAAGWIYLAGRRVLNPLAGFLGPLPRLFRWPSRIALAGGMAACLAAAAWPFWGWSGVRQNVFARAIEFNRRHEFELGFLHWVFDLDRDSYSALLHGADADDFDAAVQAGGIGPAETVAVPIDRFDVAEPKKARDFPNVLLFYLEGVVPRAISAYGQRDLPGGLKATPHMDSIAEEGARFTACRCFYPSTWDAWFAVNSGRFLRVSEMDASLDFEDRYCRYNNLYKALKLAGVNRWCHADCSAYAELFVPPDMRSSAWQPHADFDSDVSAEEEEQGIRRGDKQTQRILEFIDDLKADEKFFICEHMTDTHFPWNTTSAKRAAELGFPDGLEIYQQDARLPSGVRDKKYSAYYETITRMDAQIGLILDKLKRRGFYENTMVIIIGDHGCQWWEHEHLYDVAQLYDQCLLVPLVIKAPGLPGGQVCDEPVLQQDLLPTVMELAGVRHANPSDGVPMPCRSLVPLMRGKPSQHDLQRYRRRDVPLTTHYDQLGVISNFQHKLIFDRPSGTYLLFSLKDDPGEMHNLVDERPDLKEELLAKLRVLLNRHKSIIGQIKRSDPSP